MTPNPNLPHLAAAPAAADIMPFHVLPIRAADLLDEALRIEWQTRVQASIDRIVEIDGIPQMNVIVCGDMVVGVVNVLLKQRDGLTGQTVAAVATSEMWRRAVARAASGLI